MAGRGWRGDPPADDAEARERIIAAAMRCIDRYGPEKTGLADVAAELGVTRQTVYRIFRSSDDLLASVAVAAADPFVARLATRARSRGGTEASEMLVEALAFTLEQLPRERYLSLILTAGPRAAFTGSIISGPPVHLTDALLTRLPVAWRSLGVGTAERTELIEIYLRLLHSLLLDPGPPRTPTQLRSFLRRCIAPTLSSYQSQLSRA
jgi:AcrR family transcriptional regulator